MAKSGRAESQSISTVVDAGQRRIAMNLTLWRQRTNSTAADESLSASDGVEKSSVFTRVLLHPGGRRPCRCGTGRAKTTSYRFLAPRRQSMSKTALSRVTMITVIACW